MSVWADDRAQSVVLDSSADGAELACRADLLHQPVPDADRGLVRLVVGDDLLRLQVALERADPRLERGALGARHARPLRPSSALSVKPHEHKWLICYDAAKMKKEGGAGWDRKAGSTPM